MATNPAGAVKATSDPVYENVKEFMANIKNLLILVRANIKQLHEDDQKFVPILEQRLLSCNGQKGLCIKWMLDFFRDVDCDDVRHWAKVEKHVMSGRNRDLLFCLGWDMIMLGSELSVKTFDPRTLLISLAKCAWSLFAEMVRRSTEQTQNGFKAGLFTAEEQGTGKSSSFWTTLDFGQKLAKLLDGMHRKWPNCIVTPVMRNRVVEYLPLEGPTPGETQRLARERFTVVACWYGILYPHYNAIHNWRTEELRGEITHELFAQLDIVTKYEDPALDAQGKAKFQSLLSTLCKEAEMCVKSYLVPLSPEIMNPPLAQTLTGTTPAQQQPQQQQNKQQNNNSVYAQSIVPGSSNTTTTTNGQQNNNGKTGQDGSGKVSEALNGFVLTYRNLLAILIEGKKYLHTSPENPDVYLQLDELYKQVLEVKTVPQAEELMTDFWDSLGGKEGVWLINEWFLQEENDLKPPDNLFHPEFAEHNPLIGGQIQLIWEYDRALCLVNQVTGGIAAMQAGTPPPKVIGKPLLSMEVCRILVQHLRDIRRALRDVCTLMMFHFVIPLDLMLKFGDFKDVAQKNLEIDPETGELQKLKEGQFGMLTNMLTETLTQKDFSKLLGKTDDLMRLFGGPGKFLEKLLFLDPNAKDHLMGIGQNIADQQQQLLDDEEGDDNDE